MSSSVFSMNQNAFELENEKIVQNNDTIKNKDDKIQEEKKEINSKLQNIFIQRMLIKVRDNKNKEEFTCLERCLYGRNVFRCLHFASHLFDILQAISVSSSLFTKNISNFYSESDVEFSNSLLKVSTICDLASIFCTSAQSSAQKAQKTIVKKMRVDAEFVESGDEVAEVNDARARAEERKKKFGVPFKNKSLSEETKDMTATDPTRGSYVIKDSEIEKLDRCGVQFWDTINYLCYYSQYILWSGSYVLKNSIYLAEDDDTKHRMVNGSVLCDVGVITTSLLMKMATKFRSVRKAELRISAGNSPRRGEILITTNEEDKESPIGDNKKKESRKRSFLKHK